MSCVQYIDCRVPSCDVWLAVGEPPAQGESCQRLNRNGICPVTVARARQRSLRHTVVTQGFDDAHSRRPPIMTLPQSGERVQGAINDLFFVRAGASRAPTTPRAARRPCEAEPEQSGAPHDGRWCVVSG